MENVKVVMLTLGSAVATNGTFTVGYPSGYSRGDFLLGRDHRFTCLQAEFKHLRDFTISFGATYATVTYTGSTTLPSGERVLFQFDMAPGLQSGDEPGFLADQPKSLQSLPVVRVNPGAPIQHDADALIKAATGTEIPDAAETVTYTTSDLGSSPCDGANTDWVLDVPRNVTIAVTHGSSIVAMTVAFTGYDVHGQAMYEELNVTATGTSKTDAGQKAFKRITQIAITAASDASTNTLNVGFGDVLGLPVYLRAAEDVIAEWVNGKKADNMVSVPENFSQTDLLAGTAHSIVSPVSGTVEGVRSMATVAVTTGGAVAWDINGVAVTNGSLTVADTTTLGDWDAGVPTAANSVVEGDIITITPGATFATAGAIITFTDFRPTYAKGTFVSGSAVKPTATTGDVRGTYDPDDACDGSLAFAIDIVCPDPSDIGAPQYTA